MSKIGNKLIKSLEELTQHLESGKSLSERYNQTIVERNHSGSMRITRIRANSNAIVPSGDREGNENGQQPLG